MRHGAALLMVYGCHKSHSGPQAGAAGSVESVTHKSQIRVGFIYLFMSALFLCDFSKTISSLLSGWSSRDED